MEYYVRDLHRAIGISCDRVPLSGAAGGDYAGDLRIGGDMVGEVKARSKGQGFATLERWLGKNDVLFLKKDRTDPMVVMTWATYSKLLKNK